MANVSDISMAIKQICEEKNIPFESVIESIEAALAVAYRKEYGSKGQNIQVEFNPVNASMRIYDVKTVVADELFEEYQKEQEELEKAEAEAEKEGEDKKEKKDEKKEETDKKEDEKKEKKEGAGDEDEEEEKKFNPKTDIPLSEIQKENEDAEVDDEIKTELEAPEDYGRVAAQTAKQVIIQKLREAERDTLFNTYQDKIGQIVNATIQRVEGKYVFVDLGQATAVMPPQEQIREEQYEPGQKVKIFLVSVDKTNKGPEIIASRAHPQIVAELFRLEVPEINQELIEIQAVSREAGSRSKIAVTSTDETIDPIGSCVGQRGTRVQTVIAELGGEKIDIVEYSEDAVKFITNALAPAKILSVKLNDEEKTALVEVKEDQFSLAIGRQGQNVRLASQLTGWKLDILKEGEEPEDREKERAAQEKKKAEEKKKSTDDADKKEEKTEEKKSLDKLETKKEEVKKEPEEKEEKKDK